MFDAETLLRQLSELGRQLDEQVSKLGELDLIATGLGCEYQRLREEVEDQFADSFLRLTDGGVEAKKMAARLKVIPARLVAQDANKEWETAKSRLRTQQAAVRALGARIEIGRSLLSHEKSRMELDRLPNHT
jgi:hypothetical protein